MQAQAGFWLDLDALDRKAAAFVYAVASAPGPVHSAAQGLLFALLSGELIDIAERTGLEPATPGVTAW